MDAKALGVDSLDVKSFTKAGSAMTLIQKATSKVSGQRSDLGALQNRLEHTVNNLDNISENTQTAESRIRVQIWLQRWYSTLLLLSSSRLVSQCLLRLIARHRVYFHSSSN